MVPNSKVRFLMDEHPEDIVWKNIDPSDMWVLDKLILSRYLGYNCGPVGMDVPQRGFYIVRPCVNMMGLGLGSRKVFLDCETTHLPIGHFWCEWFEGKHLSVDYKGKDQVLTVEGIKDDNTLTEWKKWIRIEESIPLPEFLVPYTYKYPTINCEFIGGRLIEVHFRENTDFTDGMTEFIPVFNREQLKSPGTDYTFLECPEYNGRIGAWVK